MFRDNREPRRTNSEDTTGNGNKAVERGSSHDDNLLEKLQEHWQLGGGRHISYDDLRLVLPDHAKAILEIVQKRTNSTTEVVKSISFVEATRTYQVASLNPQAVNEQNDGITQHWISFSDIQNHEQTKKREYTYTGSGTEKSPYTSSQGIDPFTMAKDMRNIVMVEGRDVYFLFGLQKGPDTPKSEPYARGVRTPNGVIAPMYDQDKDLFRMSSDGFTSVVKVAHPSVDPKDTSQERSAQEFANKWFAKPKSV
jgi:hypothetical protein